MTIKDLAVFVDNTKANEARLDLAASLAHRFEAHLTGIHVQPPAPIVDFYDGSFLPELIARYEQQMRELAAALERNFRAALDREKVSGDFRVAPGPYLEAAVAQALYPDVAIIGQLDPDAVPDDGSVPPEDVILGAGRPGLVVPYAGKFATVGETVLIAWKPSREAARAVNDALPLLAPSASVTLLEVNRRRRAGGTEDEAADADILRHLALHGVKARVEHDVVEDIGVADAILSRAADLAADLIVMGCYGHSRLREAVLGGVTREILRHMTVPVLMSH